MAKLFGCPINLEAEEEDGDGSSIAVATSFSAGLPPPVNQRETNIPYFRFLDSNSDSEFEYDSYRCFIDFFDRDSYIGLNRRLSSSTSCDFDIWGTQDMEVEIELELRIGSGSGSGSNDSVELGLQVGEIDQSRVEIDTGRVKIDLDRVEGDTSRVEVDTGRVEIDWDWVEIDTGRVEINPGRVEIDTGRVEINPDRVGVDSLVEVDTGRVETNPGRVEVDTSRVEIDWDRVEVGTGVTVEAMIVDEEQPVEANLLLEEEGLSWWDHNQEWPDLFFDTDLLEETTEVGTGFWDSTYGVTLPSIDELAQDHGEEDYEDVLARTFEESEVNGSPPASKRVVDELPDVVGVTSEELSIACAICKDEIVVEERVKRLPCKHYYHGECIVPWLGIRNTCPVCRYELPTDDVEYESNRRSQRRRLN
ncbi:unnamed protein product [Eruca vesicaria subsp. sativa]|uniref:RING-type E3 ubiquitin transferase n=1 Tax=Eruca vesicaria subsp. sativa TaxID=29727 RepID=A0ABC8LTK7_ERUVS|nr:unnamed protein product [Eruca vesicaria subsp. sativa]